MTKKKTEEEIEAERKKREAEKREAEYWGPHGLRINGKTVTSVNRNSYM